MPQNYTLSNQDPDSPDTFTDLLQSIFKTLDVKSLEVSELPREIEVFYRPALLLGQVNSGGLWEFFDSLMSPTGEFCRSDFDATVDCLDEIGASETSTNVKSAVEIWETFIENRPAPGSPQWNKTGNALFEIEGNFDVDSEVVPMSLDYAFRHKDVFDDFGLLEPYV